MHEHVTYLFMICSALLSGRDVMCSFNEKPSQNDENKLMREAIIESQGVRTEQRYRCHHTGLFLLRRIPHVCLYISRISFCISIRKYIVVEVFK